MPSGTNWTGRENVFSKSPSERTQQAFASKLMPADECASLRPQCFEKSLDRLDAKKSLADLIIFKQSGERAHANQIITYQSLRHANEKYEVGTFAFFSKRNTGPAAADSENNFFHQIGSSMRKSNSALNYAGIRALASEYLFQKFFRFPDLLVGHEKLDEPANCALRGSRSACFSSSRSASRIGMRRICWILLGKQLSS
jgi:hypothetical protein